MDPYEQFLNAQGADALLGNQPIGNQQEMDTNPLLAAGLGLGSSFVASQTGGTPAPIDAMRPFETRDPYMSGEAHSRKQEFDSRFGGNQTDKFNKFAENALGPRTGPGGGIIKQAAATTPMMQPTDLMGQEAPQEDVNPFALAGLGLGGGFVAANTGGLPSASQSLSAFGQKVATQDAARQSAASAQARVNNRIIGSNMPSGGANPTVTGSVKPGTLQNVSNIIGRNLPSGGANQEVRGRVRPGTLRGVAGPATGLAALGGAGAISSTVAPAAAALIGGYLGGKAIDNLGGDAMRGLGLTERDGSMATMAGEIIGEGLYGDDNLSAFSPEELASIQQGTVASDQMATPESVSGLSFSGTPLTQEAITNPQLQFLGSQPNQVSSPEPAVTTTEDEGGGNILSRGIDFFVGPSSPEQAQQILDTQPTDPAQRARLQATAEGRGEPSDIQKAISYLFAPNEVAGDPNVAGYDEMVEAARAAKAAEVQPAAPEIPQGAPGSPQAFFEEYRSKGPLTPEQIARGEAAAARMNRTFNPDTGFSQTPAQPGVATPVTSGLVTQSGIPLSEFLSGAAIPSAGLRAESPMYADNSMSRGFTGDAGRAAFDAASAEREARLAASMQQPGETITERDTRNAAARTQSSQNVPTDVREAMLTPEGRRTAKQINRLARWSGSTQGKEMGGVAGLEQSLRPVDAQQQQYDAMRLYKLGLEIDKMQQEKPSEYQEAAAGVDEAIAAGSIKPEDRNKFILRELGWQAKEGEDSSDLMGIIYGDSSKSGGEPKFKVGEVREQGGKKYRFDGTNWNEL